MNTDELLEKMPTYINYVNYKYLSEKLLYHFCLTDISRMNVRQWQASYVFNNIPFNVDPDLIDQSDTIASFSGSTPNEAIKKLYDWCIRHNYIKEDNNDSSIADNNEIKPVNLIKGRWYYCIKTYNVNGVSFSEGTHYKCKNYNYLHDNYGNKVPNAGKLNIFIMEPESFDLGEITNIKIK